MPWKGCDKILSKSLFYITLGAKDVTSAFKGVAFDSRGKATSASLPPIPTNSLCGIATLFRPAGLAIG